MTLKQRAEEFAIKYLDYDDGTDIDPDMVEACIKMYEIVAKEWGEMGFDAAVNSRMSFKEWWREIEGE